MRTKSKYIQTILTAIVLMTMVLSAFQPALAQGEIEDGIIRDYNTETGKVTMISGENNEPITILSAMEAGLTDEDRADMLVQSFAPEFGITNPDSDLQIAQQDQPAENRVTTRYQQTYNGVPVIAGELIVNANEQGALSSMSGEVAQGLSLDTTPSLTVDEAVAIAKQGMVKWYGGTAEDYEYTEAELSIFDEKLLRPSIRPAELVWRLEMVSTDQLQPIREFVVVNAQNGNVPLHFNQIDTAWHGTEAQAGANQPPQQEDVTSTPTATEIPVTETPVPTENIQATPTAQPTDQFQHTPTPEIPPTEEPNDLNTQAVTTYYVNIATGSNSNSCTSVAAPCKNIQETINKATSGDIINVASGTYTKSTNPNPNVLQIDKSLTLVGGWNFTFTTQSGASIIDGTNVNNGILAITGTITVKNFIIQNSVSSDSGAIYIVNGTFTLANSTLKNNIASNRGAGIYLSAGNLSIINSTISSNGNSITGFGGGIYADGGTVNIVNSTIAYNLAKNGGGISRNSGIYTIKNTIIANNTGTLSAPDCNGTIATATYSIIENISGCTVTTASNNLYVDPKIDETLGGVMLVHALQTNSPAINSGTLNGCPSTDQQAIPRPQGSGCDIGASEYMVAGAPDSIEVESGSVQKAKISKVFNSQFLVLVKDESGSPVSGVTVTFTAPSSGPSGTFANTSSNITTALTNGIGIATAYNFTANNTSGVYTVEATVSGVMSSAEFELENYVPAPTSIIVNAGSSQSIGINRPFAPLYVLVKDQYESPLQGATVTFTAPATGASGTFADTSNNSTTSITNEIGIATSTVFTANSHAGNYTIDATVAGIGVPAQFQLQNYLPTIWYITTTGNNNNTCNASNSSCASISGVLNKSGFRSDDIIRISQGTYNNYNNTIYKNVEISGGWNDTFNTQDSKTYITDPITINANINLTLANVNIHGNIGITGAIYNSGNLKLKNVAIYNNVSATNGAGIYQDNGSLNLTNVTISNNRVEADSSEDVALSGGGIFIHNGVAEINNSTITQNVVIDPEEYSKGGGIANPNNKTITISNSIIAGNISDRGLDCYGLLTSNGYNLISTQKDCNLSAVLGDQIGTQADPIISSLGSLQDNGGNTLTHALIIGSMAIDAGNPATCSVFDQRGIARPQGTTCDIGAYEGSTSQILSGVVRTYFDGDSEFLPGTIVCQQYTNCSSSNADANYAHNFSIGVYEFYLNKHGRRSIDGQNGPIVSTVQYGFPNYSNASWVGTQAIYGQGFPKSDDIVAHELTHGVTQYESNLFYFYQSGAINESFSDLWGEYYDQTNGLMNDSASVKWAIGEEVFIGGNRSMSNPPAFNDPDKMTSSFYVTRTSSDDNGFVHTNSGVNNKAVYLMVDGDIFNGKTITGIGWEKTAAIYYEIQTNLLSSGADYSDLYYALQQACTNLSNTNFKGITSTDCIQVKNAVDAVEMNTQPMVNFNPKAAACPVNTITDPVLTLFSDDFENGSDNWLLNNQWSLEDFYAASPSHMMYGDDGTASSTSYLTMKNGIIIPGGVSYLYFKHAFAFESDGPNNYDGGVLEYSPDNGNTWFDAGAMWVEGEHYIGTIDNSSGTTNTLRGRAGFVTDSRGYVSSRFDISSLRGTTAKFRWVFSTDQFVSYLGWVIDDVKIYTCTGVPAIPAAIFPLNNALTTDYTPMIIWTDIDLNHQSHYDFQFAEDSNFSSLIYDVNNLTSNQYQISSDLSPNTTYYWRVRSFNIFDETNGWSGPIAFRTSVVPPTLLTPPNTLVVLTDQLSLDWSDVLAATSYTVQISTVNTFATFLVNTTVTDSIYTINTDLPANKIIYWRVFANAINGPSLASTFSFASANPPSTPTLTAPAEKALVTTYTPKLDWANSTAPTGTIVSHYQIQVSADANFTTILEEHTNIANSDFTLTSQLPANSTIYWRVRSYNTLGQYSNWTAVKTFRTLLLPPLLTSVSLPITNNRPAFDWSDVVGTTNYTLQVSTSSTFTSFAVNATVNGSIYNPVVDLTANKTLYWRVKSNGTNGPSAWSATSSFSTANPPSIPALTAPADKVLSTDYTPRLDWGNSTAPLLTSFDHYHVQIATDVTFSNLVDEQNISSILNSEYIPASDLLSNNTYYWRVRSFNGAGHHSAWSLVRSFRTALSAPASLTLPSNGATLQPTRPVFDWDDVAGATGYTIQISTVNTFASFVLNTPAGANSSYTPIKDLPANKTLYWRVISTGANGPSLPSSYFSFTTANPPSIPALTAPAENLLIANTLKPKLDWANSTVPTGTTFDHYQLQVADNASFSSIVLDQNVSSITSSEFTLVLALSPNTKYYWRVRSYNNLGQYSSWSLTRSFRIAMLAPTITLPSNGATLQPTRPVFDWDDIAGATGYTIQISLVNTFASTLVKENITGSVHTPTKDLPANKTLYWRVITNGANGPSLPSSYFSFTTVNPPSIPALTAPAENLLISNTLPLKLNWNSSTAPIGTTFDHYQLQVATDIAFSDVVLNQNVNNISTSEFTLVAHLPANTKYYWRVRSYNNLGQYSSWSLTRSFRMVMPAPALISPTGSLLTNRPTFDWDNVLGATSYTVQVSTVNTFKSFVLNVAAADSTYTPVKDLPNNKVLYWRIIANGVNGPSAPSTALSFTTAKPPSIPVLSAPAENLLITNTLTPKLDWANSTVPAGTTFDHYQLQVATDTAFSSTVLDQSVTGMSNSEFTLVSPLLPNTKYYWRVRSYNSIGQYSGWSLTRSFRVVLEVPALVSPIGSLPPTNLKPVFEWNDVAGATYYSIQISTSSTFTTTLVNTTASSSTFTPVANLPTNTAIYWRVLAQGPNGPGSWSTTNNFIIQ